MSDELSLRDVEGVGEKSEAKLREYGINSVVELAASQPAVIAKVLGVSALKARLIINSAKQLLFQREVIVRTAREHQEWMEKNVFRIPTGCRALDEALRGGVPTRRITTLTGPYGSGKTQLSKTLVVNALATLGGKAIWIETEPGTLSLDRIVEIARSRGLEVSLDDILVVPAEWVTTPQQQLLAYEAAYKKVKDMGGDLSIMVVDSFVAKFRETYSGRESFPLRGEEENRHLGMLQYIAADSGAAVVLTAQVMGVPDLEAQISTKVKTGGHGMKMYGGTPIEHGSGIIIYLDKVASDRWSATIVDSPEHPSKTVYFRISERGIVDA
jgi:RecA/RadA recombinase